MEDLFKRLYTLDKEIHDILNLKNPSHVVKLRYEDLYREKQEILSKVGYNLNYHGKPESGN